MIRYLPQRAFIAVIVAVAWLAISNHCALAAMQGAARMTMPGCHGCGASKSAPAKDGKANGIECCKVLRATLLTISKSFAEFDKLAFTEQPDFVGLIVAPGNPQLTDSLELDTGPPFLRSFAENVLQRSILAHAPPPLA